jgi:hypothetical protein
VTPARHDTDKAPGATPPAERPPTDEVVLARGKVEQTPFSMISWVAIVIGTVVVLVLVVVVAAYLIA